MAVWLDDLIAKTKTRTKQEDNHKRSKKQELLEQKKLQRALGKKFVDDLEEWLKTRADKFNQESGEQVLYVSSHGDPYHIIEVISCPEPANMWTTRIEYQQETHSIRVHREQVGWLEYSLALTEDGASMVAFFGSDTGPDRGLDVDKLGQRIMKVMIAP